MTGQFDFDEESAHKNGTVSASSVRDGKVQQHKW